MNVNNVTVVSVFWIWLPGVLVVCVIVMDAKGGMSRADGRVEDLKDHYVIDHVSLVNCVEQK